MTCKDCIHFVVCDSGRHIGEYIEDDGVYSEGVEEDCVAFEGKPSEVVKEIADFVWDGEIEGLAISMGGIFLTKSEFIDKFAGPKMKGGAE